ncbi:MAG: LUD domain-containing protein [Flavihumibacter sp.]|nr:LUD domain-containing protein [Flavihumibacter sp.]
MSGREAILNTIKANKPVATALPFIDITAAITYDDVLQQYKTVLQNIGGSCQELNNEAELQEALQSITASATKVVNVLSATPETIATADAVALEATDIAIMRGVVAVAENAAIWVPEEQMLNRLLPFICQQLVLVINENDIVPTMHHAYEKIDVMGTGFGAFIAGPSKTADIEQSLVIGAHGPVGLQVLIVKK